MQFLNELLDEPEPLYITKLEKMQELYDLNAYTNSEIRFRWIRLGLQGKWTDAIPRAVKMVTEQGRMKYLKPIYRYEQLVISRKIPFMNCELFQRSI